MAAIHVPLIKSKSVAYGRWGKKKMEAATMLTKRREGWCGWWHHKKGEWQKGAEEAKLLSQQGLILEISGSFEHGVCGGIYFLSKLGLFCILRKLIET